MDRRLFMGGLFDEGTHRGIVMRQMRKRYRYEIRQVASKIRMEPWENLDESNTASFKHPFDLGQHGRDIGDMLHYTPAKNDIEMVFREGHRDPVIDCGCDAIPEIRGIWKAALNQCLQASVGVELCNIQAYNMFSAARRQALGHQHFAATQVQYALSLQTANFRHELVNNADIVVADPLIHVRQKTHILTFRIEIIVDALLLIANSILLHVRSIFLEFTRHVPPYR